MNILFDFEDKANKYWGIPLAAIDDIKSILTLPTYDVELWISKKEKKLIDLIPEQDYKNLTFLDNTKIIASRPSNRQLWIQQFYKNFENSGKDFLYTDHFPCTSMKNSKRIIRIHDPFSKYGGLISEFFNKDKLKNKFARVLRNQAFSRVKDQSILVCNTKFTAEKMSKIYDIPLERLNVIPYGFNWNTFQYIHSIRSAYSGEENYYLMVSGLRGRKRPDIVINTWASINNLPNLVVVGNIPLDSISDQAKKQIKIGRLVLKPRVSEYDLNTLRINANAMIFASEYEGFGRPVIEALMAGVPSIANELEVFKEIDPNAIDFFSLHVPESLEQLLIKYASKINEKDSRILISKASVYSYLEVGKMWDKLLKS
jgi:mannosyltransferase